MRNLSNQEIQFISGGAAASSTAVSNLFAGALGGILALLLPFIAGGKPSSYAGENPGLLLLIAFENLRNR